MPRFVNVAPVAIHPDGRGPVPPGGVVELAFARAARFAGVLRLKPEPDPAADTAADEPDPEPAKPHRRARSTDTPTD